MKYDIIHCMVLVIIAIFLVICLYYVLSNREENKYTCPECEHVVTIREVVE